MFFQHVTTIASIYVACYLIGAINFPLVLSGIVLRQNLRNTGSGNPGFTNLLRMGNKKIALIALTLDIGRAWLVMFLCSRIPLNVYWPFVAFPLLLGNLFPVFHRFKGGKGIAMSIGIVLAICPIAGGVGIIALVALIAIWKRVSVGSLGFLAAVTLTALLVAPLSIIIVCIALTTTGTLTHLGNLKRLVNGTEPAISFGQNAK
ncbi:MAG: glycerol-3-phosphate acyltransferase [Deltaproteobacteria bacterium]|nr:glycerol-3-phosphate acyltransferase [Deltaproteobacteria bacterium]